MPTPNVARPGRSTVGLVAAAARSPRLRAPRRRDARPEDSRRRHRRRRTRRAAARFPPTLVAVARGGSGHRRTRLSRLLPRPARRRLDRGRRSADRARDPSARPARPLRRPAPRAGSPRLARPGRPHRDPADLRAPRAGSHRGATRRAAVLHDVPPGLLPGFRHLPAFIWHRPGASLRGIFSEDYVARPLSDATIDAHLTPMRLPDIDGAVRPLTRGLVLPEAMRMARGVYRRRRLTVPTLVVFGRATTPGPKSSSSAPAATRSGTPIASSSPTSTTPSTSSPTTPPTRSPTSRSTGSTEQLDPLIEAARLPSSSSPRDAPSPHPRPAPGGACGTPSGR